MTDALGGERVVVSDLSLGRPTSSEDALGHVTDYEYDADARLTRIEAPEGNAVTYGYDARGNVTETGRAQARLDARRHRHQRDLPGRLLEPRHPQQAAQHHRRARPCHRLCP